MTLTQLLLSLIVSVLVTMFALMNGSDREGRSRAIKSAFRSKR